MRLLPTQGRPTRPARQTGGFSLVEVMIASTILVFGLMALAGATTSTQLLRKRALDEDQVFRGLVSQLERARSDLFSNTAFYTAVKAAIAAGGKFQQGYILDGNGDGIQDVSSAPGNKNTPVLTVDITVPPSPGDATKVLFVQVTAKWYGAGAQRTRTVSETVANRSGYGG